MAHALSWAQGSLRVQLLPTPAPVPPTDPSEFPLLWAFAAIDAAITDLAPLFVGEGLLLFRALATLSIAWFGIQTALSGQGVQWGRLLPLVLAMSFSLAMLRFYIVDAPGLGMPVSTLPIRAADFYSQRIDGFISWNFARSFHEGWTELTSWSFFDFFMGAGSLIWTFVILLFNTACTALLIASIAAGRVAAGACVVLGPLFIPWLFVPRMDFLFWGWLRSYLQFSFYTAVGWTFLALCTFMLDGMWQSVPSGLSAKVTWFFYSAAVLLVAVLSMFKVHALTNAIFHGGGSFASGAASVVSSAARRVGL